MKLAVEQLTPDERSALRCRIARALSDILSDQFDCKVTYRFIPKGEGGENAGAD